MPGGGRFADDGKDNVPCEVTPRQHPLTSTAMFLGFSLISVSRRPAQCFDPDVANACGASGRTRHGSRCGLFHRRRLVVPGSVKPCFGPTMWRILALVVLVEIFNAIQRRWWPAPRPGCGFSSFFYRCAGPATSANIVVDHGQRPFPRPHFAGACAAGLRNACGPGHFNGRGGGRW